MSRSVSLMVIDNGTPLGGMLIDRAFEASAIVGQISEKGGVSSLPAREAARVGLPLPGVAIREEIRLDDDRSVVTYLRALGGNVSASEMAATWSAGIAGELKDGTTGLNTTGDGKFLGLGRGVFSLPLPRWMFAIVAITSGVHAIRTKSITTGTIATISSINFFNHELPNTN